MLSSGHVRRQVLFVGKHRFEITASVANDEVKNDSASRGKNYRCAL